VIVPDRASSLLMVSMNSKETGMTQISIRNA
jgi:hypothetical protein